MIISNDNIFKENLNKNVVESPSSEEFLKELRELLKKYKADISFCLEDGSDTYGIFGERMSISINDNEVLSINGWSVSASDIK